MSFKKLLPVVIILLVMIPVAISAFVSIYSQGIAEITLPDMAGLTSEEAISMLQTLNLNARVAGGIYDKNISEGKVVSQRPESGRRVKEGRVVNLIISKGQRTVFVPNIVGRDYEGAKQYLEELGLSVGMIIEENNYQFKDGVVLDQFPSAEAEIRLGSPVDMTVNSYGENYFTKEAQ